MQVKLGRIQRRVLEIGLISRIAHNLARYTVIENGAYTASEFIFQVEELMVERGVPAATIAYWMDSVEAQAQVEVNFFKNHGSFPDSHGGTAVTVETLIGDVLRELGY